MPRTPMQTAMGAPPTAQVTPGRPPEGANPVAGPQGQPNGPRQPIQAPTGLPYGEHQELVQAQQSAPLPDMSGQPAPQGQPGQPVDPITAAKNWQMPQLPPWEAPTQYPGRPIGSASPPQQPQTPISQMLGGIVGASPAIQRLAEMARQQGQ
jgi:hypothetical protein